MGEDFLRLIIKRHMAVIHNDDPLDIFCDILHAVRYEHNGNAARLMQQRQLVKDFIAPLRVKACRRLVENQKIRVHREHTGNRHAALLAAGKFKRRFFIHLFGKSDVLQRFFRTLSALLGGKSLVFRAEADIRNDIRLK